MCWRSGAGLRFRFRAAGVSTITSWQSSAAWWTRPTTRRLAHRRSSFAAARSWAESKSGIRRDSEMATTRTALSGGALALYAVAAVTATAAASSAFFLWARGASAGLAVAAALPPSLLLGIIALASRFLCNALPLRSASRSSIAIGHAGSAAAASGVWVLMWKSWVPALNQQFAAHVAPDYPLLFALGVLLYLAAVAVHYLVLEIEALREAEDEVLRYRVLAREAELRAFKAQVDPHFLFNSLNAVASLCGSRPADARTMAQLMADFFRLTLRVGSRERITVAEEIDLVSRYLAIERVRFGARLATEVDVDDRAAQ